MIDTDNMTDQMTAKFIEDLNKQESMTTESKDPMMHPMGDTSRDPYGSSAMKSFGKDTHLNKAIGTEPKKRYRIFEYDGSYGIWKGDSKSVSKICHNDKEMIEYLTAELNSHDANKVVISRECAGFCSELFSLNLLAYGKFMPESHVKKFNARAKELESALLKSK